YVISLLCFLFLVFQWDGKGFKGNRFSRLPLGQLSCSHHLLAQRVFVICSKNIKATCSLQMFPSHAQSCFFIHTKQLSNPLKISTSDVFFYAKTWLEKDLDFSLDKQF
ncbi:hypothetical protein ACROYT_G042978, partial [Oculina patagonica]